jgi:hypothetical protein
LVRSPSSSSSNIEETSPNGSINKNEAKWSRFLSRFDNNEDDTSWFETTKRGKLVTDDDVTITLDEKMKSVLTNTYGLTLPHNN